MNAHVDFNDKIHNNVHSIRVNSFPILEEHLTSKTFVDRAISEGVDDSSLLRLDPVGKLNLDEQDSFFHNSTLTSPKMIIELPSKSYTDSSHEENEGNRKDLGIDFYDESNELVKNDQDIDFNDNKLTNIDSVTVNRNPTADNEVSNKKCYDDEIDKNTIVRFNQTLQNYPKASIGNDT